MGKFWRLAYQVGKRDLHLHQAGSSLGVLWEFSRPLFTIAAFTLVFSRLVFPGKPGAAGMKEYAVFLGAVLFPWQFFTQTISRVTTSFTSHGRIILSRRIPLLAIPAGLTLTQTLILGWVYGIFLLAALAVGGIRFQPSFALLPLVMLAQQALALGIGLLCSTFHVFVRDVGPTLDSALKLWFWLTPIAYRGETIVEPARAIFTLNPYAAIAECYRSALGVGGLRPEPFLSSAAVAGVALLLALFCYGRLRKRIPDMVG